MSKGAFHRKRVEIEGLAMAEAGFRNNDVQYRVRVRDQIIANMTFDDLYDLADAVDAIISREEEEPLTSGERTVPLPDNAPRCESGFTETSADDIEAVLYG